MSTLAQLRTGVHRFLDSLSEGWRQLSSHAGHALTRFTPAERSEEPTTGEDVSVARSPKWGVLFAEVSEDANSVTVKIEAPGMSSEDFDVQVVDGVLVVRGEKRMQREDMRGRYHVTECAYGRFERAVALPAPVRESKARARYRNGVLRIDLPKTAEARSRRIRIESS